MIGIPDSNVAKRRESLALWRREIPPIPIAADTAKVSRARGITNPIKRSACTKPFFHGRPVIQPVKFEGLSDEDLAHLLRILTKIRST